MPTDTKTALMDFAEHTARARGFDGFSFADLSEAVGIRKASVHYHFPTKAVLSAALIDRYRADLERTCAEIDTNFDAAADKLKALIDIYREALDGGKMLCLCVSFVASRESLSDDVNDKVGNLRTMMINWIVTVFELATIDKSISGVRDPALEARSTLALLEGAQLAARSDENIKVFDEATELLKQRC